MGQELDMRSILQGELEIGQPLPWDIFGDGGNLLARKGYVLISEGQIDNLVKRGRVVQDAPKAVVAQPPSVVRMLNAANRRLQVLLAELTQGGALDMRKKLAEVANVIVVAVDLHADVALACILHNQRVGPYAVRHSIDTAVVSLLVARAMNKSAQDISALMMAALTMNVGMFQHQDRMQTMREPLTEDDFKMIHQHPALGVGLLKQAGVTDLAWLDCVLMHHENENGSGYPNNKTAPEISECAKLLSLADRYCARVSARAYRKPMLPNAALRDILLEGQSTIDPKLAAFFIRVLGIYPIGTFVRLLNGEIGVVTRKGVNTTTPIVDSLVGPRGAPLEVVLRRDTKDERHAIREVLTEDQAAILFSLDQLWGRVASL